MRRISHIGSFGFIFSLLAMLFAAGCEREYIVSRDLPGFGELSATSPTLFTATIGGGDTTKTTLGDADASGDRPVKWSGDDSISIGGGTYTVSSGAGTTTATFTGSGAVKDNGVYKAYYPVSLYNSGTPALPAVQRYAAGRIDNLPMYAESSDTELNFKNLCTVLEFKLTGDGTKALGSIGVKSAAADRKLSGPFTVNWNNGAPALAMSAGASDSVTLHCGAAGVALSSEAKSFFVAIPAQEYRKDELTVTLKDLSGGVMGSFALLATNILERSTIYEIAKEANSTRYMLVHTGTTDILPDGTVVQEVIRVLGSAGATGAASFDSYLTCDGGTTKKPVSISGTYEYAAADDSGNPVKNPDGTVAWTTTPPEGLSEVIVMGADVDKTLEATLTGNETPVIKEKINMTAFHAAALKRNGSNGFTQLSPQDLSLYDITSMTSRRVSGKPVTANCYVVDRAGWYMFPAVYGNAIDHTRSSESGNVNGVNTTSYSGFARNYTGMISSPYILDDTGMTVSDCEAVILWEDVESPEYAFVESVSLAAVTVPSGSFYDPVSGSYKTSVPYIKFKVPATKLYTAGSAETSDPAAAAIVKGARQGNALIALRKKSDRTILWSWHIWVTDGYDVDGDRLGDRLAPIPVKEWGGGISNLMPVNLGYCETDEIVSFKDRVWFVRIRQDAGSAEPLVFRVRQRTPAPPKYNSGTFYQWGRKDPFLPWARNNFGQIRIKSSYSPAGVATFEFLQHPAYGISYSIMNPACFMVQTDPGDILSYSYSWMKNTDRLDYLWNRNCVGERVFEAPASKTVYDPCPPGYCIPDSRFYSGFADTRDRIYLLLPGAHVVDVDGSGDITMDDFKDGVTFYTDESRTGTIYFPFAGYLQGTSLGNAVTAGSHSYVTTSCRNGYSGGNTQNTTFRINGAEFGNPEMYTAIGTGKYNVDALQARPVREDHLP